MSVLDPKVVERRAASLLSVLSQRGLVLGRKADSGKHQIICGQRTAHGHVDLAVVVAGVAGRSVAQILGEHLVEGLPSAEKVADLISAQFVVAEAAT